MLKESAKVARTLEMISSSETDRPDSKRTKKQIKFIAGLNYDTSVKHKSACRSRTGETGIWLTEQSEDFRKWMLGDTGTFFWLHGIGKLPEHIPCYLRPTDSLTSWNSWLRENGAVVRSI